MESRRPTVIIPYAGPYLEGDVQDIVLYLRPESNGVRTESCMLKVLKAEPAALYRLVYLANLPGEFIAAERIIERRYALRDRFAREGGAAFTETMKRLFEAHFGVAFDPARVIGAYEALERLGMSEEELFELWVEGRSFTKIHEQSIKRVGDFFVVNYDVPALLHRDNDATDIFAMVLRSLAPYAAVHALVDRMCAALAEAGILSVRRPPSRVFHYSTSPFMQILDGTGYVYQTSGAPIERSRLSFCAYLLSNGVAPSVITQTLERPIMRFRTPSGVVERHIFEHTYESSFAQALEKLQSRVA